MLFSAVFIYSLFACALCLRSLPALSIACVLRLNNQRLKGDDGNTGELLRMGVS
jgi:hypothetical protein